MVEFLNISLARTVADSMVTPREMLRDYMTVLNILMQNDNIVFEDVVNKAFGDALPSEEKDESPENPQVAPIKRRPQKRHTLHTTRIRLGRASLLCLNRNSLRSFWTLRRP